MKKKNKRSDKYKKRAINEGKKSIHGRSEMSKFDELEELLECDIFFADPGKPGQRGLNENTNGLLRQYFPKSYNFQKITQKDVGRASFRINNRPRKSLGYNTPLKTYFDIPPAFVITALQL